MRRKTSLFIINAAPKVVYYNIALTVMRRRVEPAGPRVRMMVFLHEERFNSKYKLKGLEHR
jgi:hypothetical protein